MYLVADGLIDRVGVGHSLERGKENAVHAFRQIIIATDLDQVPADLRVARGGPFPQAVEFHYLGLP